MEKIINILSQQLGVDKSKINKDSKIQEDLGADSLDIVELLMLLEEEYGIEVEDEVALNLKTVNDVYKIIQDLPKK